MIRRILKVKNKLFRRSHKASSTSNPAPSFVYEPLEPGQIRVLQLAAGKKGDIVSGELLIANIDDDSLKYDALSYMWGDPAPTNTIYLSGKALPIASNLNTALHYLRYTDKTLIIWIDAICINQEDEIERAEQVQLMRRLYSGASTVRVWINEPDIDANSQAVAALKRFHVAVDAIHNSNDFNASLESKLGEDPNFWTPVMPIFSTEYWGRAWIQQEVLNAAQLSLHCMDMTIPGSSIEDFHLAASIKFVNLQTSAKSSNKDWRRFLLLMVFGLPPAITLANQYRGGVQKPNLCDILSEKGLRMTRSQDRMYALMHLANDYVEGGIVVDYTKSGVDVMVEAAAYHVRVHRNLRFLQHTYLQASSDRHGHREQELYNPTWLPRSWLGENTRINVGDWPTTTVTSCLAESISTTDRRLHIRAMRVDHVGSCLNRGLTSGTLTTCQFWNSSLGLYLRDFAGPGAKCLPPAALEVLIRISDMQLKEYAKFARIYSEAKDDHAFQSGQSEWDENDKDQNLTIVRKASSSALSVLLQLAQDPLRADQYIFQDCALNTELLETVDPVTMAMLHELLFSLYDSLIIKTQTEGLGRVVNSAIDDADEIWIALGCDQPIVLRPQPSGRYWFVCAAAIPDIQKDEILKQFTSDVQPEDKIGEWIVEDIEIE